MKKTNKVLLALALFSLAVLTFTGCTQDDDPTNLQVDDLEVATNNWIYSTMQSVYYWTDEMPADVETKQDPSAFFKKLLSSEDRFSVIVPDYEELINSLGGVSKEAGYEFGLAKVSGSDDVVAFILYVKEGSPAKDEGLKRGDVIKKINGTTITLSNYKELVPELYGSHNINYYRFNEDLDTYEDMGDVDLTAVVLAENPSLLDTVYSVNGKKIGYYVYNFFSPGDNKAYDNEMDQIIAQFKSEGINSLILDLRYNSGGAVSSAKNLASLIGTGVSSSKIFYQNQFNDNLQDYYESQPNGDQILRSRFLDKSENVGDQIGGELYILTGSRSASASELIINGLDPYMNVTIIGDTTVGKNVGSIPLEDEENAENKYGILPIVFKIANSQGYSGYADGFTPLGENLVRDLQEPMKALGDLEEPLLARAISLIEGGTTGGRKAITTGRIFTPIMTSIDRKVRTNRLILDQKHDQ